jgi:uncharacterized membrane protein AbrB (regulator of aidB expression)
MLVVLISGVLVGLLTTVAGAFLAGVLFFLTNSFHEPSLMGFAITIYIAAWASGLVGLCVGAIIGARLWQRWCQKLSASNRNTTT